MAISDMTSPNSDDERKDPFDGEDGADDEVPPFAEEQDHEHADEIYQDDELPLPDDDARLPWLEGDDGEEDEYDGYSTGQTIALVLAALLVLGLVVGGVWWISRPGPDTDLVADGGTIKNEGPYKERPDDPGGKVFEGTGDSSFKVSEGQSNPARLGQGDATPAPGFETLDQGANGVQSAKGPNAKPADVAASETGDLIGVGVQIGAYSNRATAETGWNRLSQQYGALKGLRHRVVEGEADIGTVYRLQAVAVDATAADALCSGLKSSGLNCYVKR